MVRLLDSLLVMGDGSVIFQGRENDLEGYLQVLHPPPWERTCARCAALRTPWAPTQVDT